MPKGTERHTGIDILAERAIIVPVGVGIKVLLPLSEVVGRFNVSEEYLRDLGVLVGKVNISLLLPSRETERKENYRRLCEQLDRYESRENLSPQEQCCRGFLQLRAFAYSLTLDKNEGIDPGENLANAA